MKGRSHMLSGSIVAIVTPMHDDGRLDYERFKSLIDFHIEQGTDGIVVVGTTGESPTVDFDEHKELIRLAVAHARGRIPIVAGTGGNSTAEAIELTQSARNAGADACLSVVPYYNKPTQEGLYRHFRAIAETVDIPQIVYNVPGRTVADLANETTLRLAQVPNIVGIKDATASIERGSDLLRRAPKNFTIYSGDDATCLALILLGGTGRRSEEGARAEFQAARASHQALRGGEPDPGQMGGGSDGADRHGHSPAAHAALASIPRSRQGSHAAGRRHALERPARRRGQGGMTRYGAGAVAAAMALMLAGCGSTLLDSAKVEYKSEKKLPPLDVPPDLTAPAREERYQIPETNPAGATTFSAYNAERAGAPRPGSTGLLPEVDKVRLERSASERWLVVSEPAEKVWPVVKDFWQGLGFVIKVEVPEAGVMETDWAENRAKIKQDFIRNFIGGLFDGAYSTGERDKFRTRLERGAQPGTTEIYITQQRDSTVWQPRPVDPSLEAEFLRRLMVRFGAADARAQAQLAAADKKDERAKISRADNGVGTLELAEPFDRAWRRVGLVLDRVGFTVEDRDRSKGFYFVRYVDSEAALVGKQDEGFLSKLAFWRSAPDPKAEQYRVFVKDRNDSSEVQVLNKEGNPDSSETAQRILSLLKEQLK